MLHMKLIKRNSTYILIYKTMTDKIGSTRKCVRTKCPRRKLNTYCGEGGGGFICMHGRRKSVCKECGGASICEHWREQCKCEECGGGSICEHGRWKPQCPDCNGSHICRANGEAYNSGCRTSGTEDWTGSALTALLIYSPMILGH